MITRRIRIDRTCDECGAERTEYEGEARDGSVADTWSSVDLNGECFDFCDDDCRTGKVAKTVRRLGGAL